MNTESFKKFLATGEYVPAMDSAETDLEKHDRRFHPNGFDPEKDSCEFRENREKGDKADSIPPDVGGAMPDYLKRFVIGEAKKAFWDRGYGIARDFSAIIDGDVLKVDAEGIPITQGDDDIELQIRKLERARHDDLEIVLSDVKFAIERYATEEKHEDDYEGFWKKGDPIIGKRCRLTAKVDWKKMESHVEEIEAEEVKIRRALEKVKALKKDLKGEYPECYVDGPFLDGTGLEGFDVHGKDYEKCREAALRVKGFLEKNGVKTHNINKRKDGVGFKFGLRGWKQWREED